MASSPARFDKTPVKTGQPNEAAGNAVNVSDLNVAEERFRAMFEHAPIGVVLANAGSTYTDANPAACAMLGYTRAEFVGLNASDIVAQINVADIEPAIAEAGSGPGHRGVWSFRRKDGSILLADVIATRLPDGTLLGMLHDRSDREEAGAYRDHLAAIVSSSSDGIVGEDIAGHVVSWNAAAERIFGYSAKDMIGAPIQKLLPEDRARDASQRMDRLRRGEIVPPSETQRRGKDGRLLNVTIATSPIWDAAGRLIGASHNMRDVTARHARDREIALLTRLYAALRQIDLSIMVSSGTDDLFQQVCRIMVARGGFRLAWVGWQERVGGPMRLQASGSAEPIPRGQLALRTDQLGAAWPTNAGQEGRQTIINNDLLAGPDPFLRWADGLPHDLLACAFMPVRLAGHVRGLIGVYADRADMFHDRSVALLDEAASHISLALDNQARDQARRQAEEQLRNEKAFSDTIIESLPGIVYFYDDRGRFLRWNHNLETVSGYSTNEIEGLHPLDFVAPTDRAAVQARIAEVFETGEASIEATLQSRDGTLRPYLFTGRRVEFDGKVCLVGAGVDLSERVGRHRAEAADKIKSAFLATMSHELRTPLNSIIGFTGILLQQLPGPLNAEQSKQLGMVRVSARHLLALVNDVLDISRIEAGQLEIERQSFDPSASIARVVSVVTPLAKEKGLALRTVLEARLGTAVSDQRRFEQVLLNLLSNAIKCTDAGEVTLRAEAIAADQASIRIEVADTGIGIRREDLESLFQPFQQVDGGLARRSEGTGLGLAICRRLCTLMGGTIEASSDLGLGSVFRVTLPLLAPSPKEVTVRETTSR